MPRRLWALAAVLALFTAFPGAAQGERYVAGSAGSGDPFFPLAGNGGYDVRHYALELTYLRASNRLSGVVTVSARATQNLDRFNLDLRDFYDVARVRVNGKSMSFSHQGQELSIS